MEFTPTPFRQTLYGCLFLHYFSLYSCNASLGLISGCLVLCLFHIFLIFFGYLPFLELLPFWILLLSLPHHTTTRSPSVCICLLLYHRLQLQLQSLLFQPCPTVPQLSYCPQYLYSFLVTFLNMPSLPLVSLVSIP